VNPHACVVAIEKQADEWFHLLKEDELASFHQLSYIEKVLFLAERVQAEGKCLILRDWTTVNFLCGLSVIERDALFPSGTLEQAMYFTHYDIQAKPIVIARRAAEVYASLQRAFDYLERLDIKEFGSIYWNYAQSIADYPIVHYETFCESPETTMQYICEVLGAYYDPGFTQNFGKFMYCTGDTSLSSPSRGYQLAQITPLSSYQGSESYELANANANCQAADRLLGYGS
jgi:hypothetical protein